MNLTVREIQIAKFKESYKRKMNFKVNNMKVNLELSKKDFDLWITYLKNTPRIEITY